MATSYPKLSDANLRGKRVLVRVDHNVTTNKDGKLKNDEKIRATLPTIKVLLEQKARIILVTHVGRPKGKKDPALTTKTIAEHLRTLLPGVSVTHVAATVGPGVEAKAKALKDGEILYLENVRFHPEEEGEPAEQESFGKQLAALAEVFVNEAFASCHPYEEASTCAVARHLTSYAGENLRREVEMLSPVLEDPKRPLTLIISGAKMETKIPVVEYFLSKGDDILIGGAIANTFLAAKGLDVGKSLYEAEQIDMAKGLLAKSGGKGCAMLHVPLDATVAPAPTDAPMTDVPVGKVGGNLSIFDIGGKTADEYRSVIEKSGMIIWNGPMGMYETEHFSLGSKKIAEAMRAATKNGSVTIVGGGDTLDFHARYTLDLGAYTFVSTGGGAMLEFISGEEFPALRALAA